MTELKAMRYAREPGLVIDAFVRLHGLNRREVVDGAGRTRALTVPRHELMWMLRDLTSLSYQAVGKLMGGRDSTTVLAGINNVAKRAAVDPAYRDGLARVRRYILSFDTAACQPQMDAASALARSVMIHPDPESIQSLAIAMLSVESILLSVELTDAEARQAALTIIRYAATQPKQSEV